MKYPIDLLSPDEFENLVNCICYEELGTGVIAFAVGKDGGKDGKFTGTAARYPSSASPWSGKFIIQAKHTGNPIASCSDADFTALVNAEIIKINKMKANNEIDNYLLFTNRKFTGISGDAINNRIKKETGLSNVQIIGIETISDLYLPRMPAVVKQFKLDYLRFPISFSEDDVKTIILQFKTQLPTINSALKSKINPRFDFQYLDKAQKNQLNQLSDSYYREQILGSSFPEFSAIDGFLNDPANDQYKEQYYDVVVELSHVIHQIREEFSSFEEMIWHIYKMICDGDSNMSGKKRHVIALLHYMYMECLIGKKS